MNMPDDDLDAWFTPLDRTRRPPEQARARVVDLASSDARASTRRRGRLACADGHRARSQPERVIDDWLFSQGIVHDVEPELDGLRPDWRVGDVYIEYWGLAGQQGYDARRAEKLAIYRARRLALVELFPDDLADLEGKLGALRAKRRRDADITDQSS